MGAMEELARTGVGCMIVGETKVGICVACGDGDGRLGSGGDDMTGVSSSLIRSNSVTTGLMGALTALFASVPLERDSALRPP